VPLARDDESLRGVIQSETPGKKTGIADVLLIVYTRHLPLLAIGLPTTRKGLRMRRRLLVALMTSLWLFGPPSLLAAASAPEAFQLLAPEQRRAAPAFTLPDHRGMSLDSAALRDKVVVIRFWATW
jgi:hypothetical protein